MERRDGVEKPSKDGWRKKKMLFLIIAVYDAKVELPLLSVCFVTCDVWIHS